MNDYFSKLFYLSRIQDMVKLEPYYFNTNTLQEMSITIFKKSGGKYVLFIDIDIVL